MRLSTFLFLVLGVASLGGTGWFLWHATADSREWRRLRSYSGRDLKGGGEEIQALVERVLGGSVLPSAPVRWVAALDGPESRQGLLLCQPLNDVAARLILIDDRRRKVFTTAVRLRRWSESITGLRGNTRPDLAPWTFAIEMDGNGAEGLGLVHYAVLDDSPVLIRLERPSGESVPNVYRDGDPIGALPPLRIPENWEKRLSSESLAEILEVLVWLGGIHAEPVMGRAGYPTESPYHVDMFHETARRPGVLARLRDLSRHPQPWITHAAEQTRNRLEK